MSADHYYHLRVKLTIIVPCLNEQENIAEALGSILNQLENIDYEILIVDDQSDDSTIQEARLWMQISNTANVRLLTRDLERRGYGAVIKYGLAYAKGDFVLFYSADMVDPIHLLPKMLNEIENSDLVQISRYIDPKNSLTIPFRYKFYQYFYRKLTRYALGESVADSTYAFKLFRREKVLSLGLSSNRFSISPEIYFKSHLAGYRIRIIEGAQSTRERGVSKFYFSKEAPGFIVCLIRAFLHRKGVIYWF